MSAKHFFADTPGVVVLGLESLVARNPHLALDRSNKVVYQKAHDPSKIALISGGGAGHEPAWSGYVGHGMLTAAVSGEVFASPSTKQIMAAVEQIPSDVGIILCITNYTGDNLHFGLAREKAAGLGYRVGVLRMSEDVGLGRKQIENTGRRGLAGNMFVLKLCGAAAARDYSFDDCLKIGKAVNDNCGTIGSSLDYCHIPGRKHHEQLAANSYSVALGIHNEPGLLELSPIPPAEEMISKLLKYLLDPSDTDRNYVSYAANPSTALLINNFGGMSNFEIEALTAITLRALKSEWSLVPDRVFVQSFETSLNAPGWSVSLLNVSGIADNTSLSVSTLYELLDSETSAPSWPRNGYAHAPSNETKQAPVKSTTKTSISDGPTVSAPHLASALRKASNAVLAAEPDITHWDQITGDGDCGEAVSSMSQAILSVLDSVLPHNSSADSVPLLPVLSALSDAIEDTGGSLAAILAIYVASFGAAMRDADLPQQPLSVQDLASSAAKALTNLMDYTRAREGGRTVMDALIPFVRALEEKRDVKAAVEEAERGARGTEGMPARFGRASYLSHERMDSAAGVPMDPGAWAAVVFLKGLVEGWHE